MYIVAASTEILLVVCEIYGLLLLLLLLLFQIFILTIASGQ